MAYHTSAGRVEDDGKAVATDQAVPGRVRKFRYELEPSKRRKVVDGELTSEVVEGEEQPSPGSSVILGIASRQTGRGPTLYATDVWGIT